MPRYAMRSQAAVLSVLCLAVASACAAEVSGPMSSSRPASGTAAAPAASSATEFDVHTLFASTCGWCHSAGGRVAGKGPQLMATSRTDAEIIYRIKNGKPGAMPAFSSAFNDDQLKAIVKYIRDLKPEGSAK